jgi:molybdopterin-guanine dinucleotide biosynthesis protein A
MGGVDKGLQPLQGRPLVAHVLERLAPQVGPLLINANRNLDSYRAFGHPVLPDADGEFNGPLAGLLAGLQACTTPWLLAVPCDSPLLPTDLGARLFAAAESAGAELALPECAEAPGAAPRLQPVFCLLRTSLAAALADYLAQGGRKLESWMRAQSHVVVPFERPDDVRAFFNANTVDELATLEQPR